MDSMEYNKIAAAVLTAGIAFAGFGIVADNLSHPARLTHTVLDIKGAEPAAQTAAPVPEGPKPIEPLLVSANPADGEAYTHKICVACHNFKEGAGAKVGPDLYGVVGREQASAPGFEYSSALKSHHGKWTYDNLNDWLYKPAAYAKGTKMAYAGLSDDKLRADVIDYLRTLAKDPEPLPTPEQVKAAEAKEAPAPKPAAAAAPAGENLPPLAPLLASADPEAGHAYTKKICIACHNFAEGAGAKVGPNLYGVVGRERASMPGYEYSAALKGKPGKWTYETLNEWLYKPAAFAKGTKMAYAGLSDAKLRADVIDYLRTLSKSPEPLPAAGSSAIKPAAESKPAPSSAAPKSTPGASAPSTPASAAPASAPIPSTASKTAQPAPASSAPPAASKPAQAAASTPSAEKTAPSTATPSATTPPAQTLATPDSQSSGSAPSAPAPATSKPEQAAAPSAPAYKSAPSTAPTPATSASPAAKPAADVPKASGSSGGASAPSGQATQAGPNQNQPTDAQSQQQQPPQAHKVEPAAPGAPAAQGKPN